MGTIRSENLDHILFWTTADLENKLLDFRSYFKNHRTHTSRAGRTPDTSVSRPLRISTRFNGNLTVEVNIRPPWLPDFSRARAQRGIRSTSAKNWNEIIRCSRS